MPRKFKLEIDNPCSEKWENFENRRARRGFCSSCQKEVIDFTKYSDSEIRGYFKNLPQNVCGRLRDDQIRVYGNPNTRKGLSRWLAWSIAATATLFSGYAVSGQEVETIENVSFIPDLEGKSLEFPRKIGGVVRDKYGETLEGVEVLIEGHESGNVVTDSLGRYEIEIPNKESFILFQSASHSPERTRVGLMTSGDIVLTTFDASVLHGRLGGITSCGIVPERKIDRTKEWIIRLFR